MNQTDRPVANPVVVLREEFDDWAVLFNPDTADAAGINAVGVTVWKQMNGRRSIAEIVADVTHTYSDTPAAVLREIDGFITRLHETGFVGMERESV